MRIHWPVTQSAIDLNHITNLAESIDRFASALSSVLPDGIQKISDIREGVQDYAPAYDYDDYVDLGDLADLCKSNIDNEKVVAAASDVLAELKKIVVAEVHLGDDVKWSHGLTIWFPETADKYHNHRAAYRKLAMTKRYKKWNGFLAKYHPRRPREITLERTEISNR